MKKSCLLLLILFSLTACETVNDVLQVSGSVLNTANTILGGANSVGGSGLVYVDTTAKNSAQRAVDNAVVNSSLRAMYQDAKSTIAKMTAYYACGATRTDMAIFSDPSADEYAWQRVTWGVSYHKSGCMSVSRIDGFKKESANAFAFRVIYQSPQSQETATRRYVAVKQPDGAWLFIPRY